MTGKQLWDMKLFQQENVHMHAGNSWTVLRVPGGWIMRETFAPTSAYCFVPLNNEFYSILDEEWEDHP